MVLRMVNEAVVLILCLLVIFVSFKSEYTRVAFTAPLLQTVNGSVGHGNFTYWKLSRVGDYDGPLIIELISHKGDADLYVSNGDRPSYEPHLNDFNSVTCGVDEVRIPEDFPRPITIGIYGHAASDLSTYTLRIYYDVVTATNNLRAKLNSDWDSGEVFADQLQLQNFGQDVDEVTADSSKVKLYSNGEPEDQHSVWRKTSKLVGLLSLIDTLFELFFL